MCRNNDILSSMGLIRQGRLSVMPVTPEQFDKVFAALDNKHQTSSQGIFFDGQMFDAYVFINDLFRQAKRSIILIDNY